MEKPTDQRLIFHIDVNSAFLSWECVYRLSKHQALDSAGTVPSAAEVMPKSTALFLPSPLWLKSAASPQGEPCLYRPCANARIIVPSRFGLRIQCSQRHHEAFGRIHARIMRN